MALELDHLALPHRDLEYTLDGGAPAWDIARDGTVFGRLVIKSPAGEEGEPVYETVDATGTAVGMEGTDWEHVVKAFLNEVDPEVADPFSGTTASSQ